MADSKMIKFEFGKEKRSFSYYVKTGLLIKIPLEIASHIPGISKKQVFNLIDQIQLKFNIDAINDYVIKDEELLNYRIERIVTNALKKYED
jgi:hypothetical protein